ncbi:hypothetical protein N7528_008322 [Penicillium herquei]|nr:hypothetical protein N7528_008322 [Penicillium herquei]
MAVDHIYQIHVILPDDSNANLAKIQHNLSHMNLSLYWETNGTKILFVAIEQAKDAINITADSDPALVIYVKNLAGMLRLRWKMTGRIEDLLEAVQRDQQVINLAEKDDPQLALYLHTLGSTYSLFGCPHFRALAIGSSYLSWKCEFGAPIVRLQSARAAVRLLKKESQWTEALDIAKQTVNLIPDINNRSLSRDDQRHVSLNFSGLAEDICSLMLQLNKDPYEVLHWSELCRGVIIHQLMDDRSEISILAQSYPEKATAYDRLRIEVNATTPDLEGDDFRLMRTQKLLEAVTKLDECISDIRALPGFEQFLLGPSLSELKHHAAEGPIIIVNVTELRSDAIIIQESGVDSIGLPQLSRKKTTEWIEQSLTTYNDPIERGKKNKRYLEFLKWLWTSCVELVLDKVFNQTENPGQGELPRVWWIGVGIATHLPFHAAGDHSARSTNNTISRAISSYTPTVKALIYSRERGTTISRLDENKPKAMVVTMPHTPGKVDLPGVEREKAAIEEHSGSTFITSALNEPSSKAVLENVKECDVLHFAGHGISDYHDPFNSSLLLTKHDGADAVVDRLTVRDIFDLHLKQAKLAYLSACSTAEVQEEKLLDEVIHLASGFQVAGFNHVIASMWQTDDDACEEMASDFYNQLKKGGQQALDNRAVVAAAHHATLAVRSRWPRRPLMWAPPIPVSFQL